MNRWVYLKQPVWFSDKEIQDPEARWYEKDQDGWYWEGQRVEME